MHASRLVLQLDPAAASILLSWSVYATLDKSPLYFLEQGQANWIAKQLLCHLIWERKSWRDQVGQPGSVVFWRSWKSKKGHFEGLPKKTDSQDLHYLTESKSFNTINEERFDTVCLGFNSINSMSIVMMIGPFKIWPYKGLSSRVDSV